MPRGAHPQTVCQVWDGRGEFQSTRLANSPAPATIAQRAPSKGVEGRAADLLPCAELPDVSLWDDEELLEALLDELADEPPVDELPVDEEEPLEVEVPAMSVYIAVLAN